MKFGIIEESGKVFCKNCEALISEEDNFHQEYCINCGNPLTFEAITETQKRKLLIERNLLKQLKESATELKTDSFAKIISKVINDYK